MNTTVVTGGETLSVGCEPAWVSRLIAETLAGEHPGLDRSGVSIVVEASHARFDTSGERIARNAWRRGSDVTIENLFGVGFDLLVRPRADSAEFVYRWRPGVRERAASRALRSRFVLLVRAALVQYPGLWWAGLRGRAPLHASALSLGDAPVLICGSGGVGKSTLVLREIESGGFATDDNMSVSDGTRVWGIVEPMRIQGGGGRRMPFGRTERPFPGRVRELVPTRVAVLRKAAPGIAASARAIDPATAARALVAGTYIAGELRRYWSFAGILAEGTGMGPVHPPIADVAGALTKRLPSVEVSLSRIGMKPLSELLEGPDEQLSETGS